MNKLKLKVLDALWESFHVQVLNRLRYQLDYQQNQQNMIQNLTNVKLFKNKARQKPIGFAIVLDLVHLFYERFSRNTLHFI